MGTRLRSVVSDVPKPLASVGGRPFLDILLEQLSSWRRLRRVVLAISYGAEQFIEHYARKTGYPFELAFSVETMPQGTAGAIRQAWDNTSSAQVLILNGDTYVHVDFDELLIAHQRSSARLTIVAIRVKDASRFGSIEVDTSSMGV